MRSCWLGSIVAGNPVIVNCGKAASLTISVNCISAVCWDESITRSVKVKVPACAGVPAIAPRAGSRVRPSGRDPRLTDHPTAPVSPAVASVCVYGVPASASGSAGALVMASAGET